MTQHEHASSAETPPSDSSRETEVVRIRSSAIMALLLFACALLLDGPVTILGWMLTGAGCLCVLYVAVSSTMFLRQSHHNKPTEIHEVNSV